MHSESIQHETMQYIPEPEKVFGSTEAWRQGENQLLIEKLETQYRVREDESFAQLVRPSDASEPIQRWFHYREGYTAELCRRFIQPSDSLVLDPFCGFGSTLLTASLMGVKSIGLDVNPLAVFVSRVKTRNYARTQIAALERAAESIKAVPRSSAPEAAPKIRILPKLFHPEALKAALTFKSIIDDYEDVVVREALQLAWLATLESISNVYKEGNGIKYRARQRKGNLYTELPYDVWAKQYFGSDVFGFVKTKLTERINTIIEDIKSCRQRAETEVLLADSRRLDERIGDEKASLALFSPPYCNCFNYIKAYKLELWMGGFIKDYSDIGPLTSAGVRSRLESLIEPVTDPYSDSVAGFANLIAQGDLWSPQLPNLVRGYFADMQKALDSIFKALKPGGRCVIVVGNSAYSGILVPTDLLLAQCAEIAGFDVAGITVARHLTTSSQQRRALAPLRRFLRESVIELQKNI